MRAKQWITAGLMLVIGLAAGWWLGDARKAGGDMDMDMAVSGDGPCEGGAEPLHWAAPMDPSYQRDVPGKSPMGMDLVPVCEGGGASAAADVVIDPSVEQNLGLRTARVQRRALTRPVRAVGTVGYDENSYRMIHSRTEGWLERFAVESEGAAVEQGQDLYALFSPKLVAAEREFLTARASGRESMIGASRERLRALGYSEQQIRDVSARGAVSDRLLRTAPDSAVVAMLGAREGQYVTPGTHIMTLARLDRVWVLVDLLERDAGRVRAGMPATATVEAFPGREWHGHVDYVYPQLDAMTRTLRVRLVFDNPDFALRPNMFARATIATDPVADALIVPVSAVIRSGRGARVVKRLEAGQFDIVPVETGLRGGDDQQILRGLMAGDEVVISGQFLIDSEANVDAESLRLESVVATGTAVGTIREVDRQAGQIRLEHGPIEPLGDTGLQMPGMTMAFELGTDPAGFRAGDSVRVTVTNPERGIYRVTRISPAAEPPAHAMDRHDDEMSMDGDHAAGEPGSGAAMKEMPAMTAGKVVAVDPQARRITLDHERIASIGMPPMTMAFSVADTVDLEALVPDMPVRFALEHGAEGMRITVLEVQE